MFGLGVIKKGVRAVATGNTQKSLGVQSPHLPAAVVRIGRFLFSSSAIVIGVTSYAAYVNEVTDPGLGPHFVLPGLGKKTQPPDRADRSPAFAANAGNTPSGKSGGAQSPTNPKGQVNPNGSVKGHPELKANISAVAATVLKHFPKLIITATTNGNHVSNSYHYQGRAVDLASSNYAYMKQAADWIAANLTSHLVEGIHNPNLSVKNGKVVPSSFWGASVWAGHANHIHLAA